MSNFIVSLSDADFDKKVSEATKPLLVDFWAEWCGPCKMVAPIFEELAKEFGEKVIFAKLNVEVNQSTPAKFGIRGIPTLLLFKNGEVVATQVGALSKLQLKTFLENHI